MQSFRQPQICRKKSAFRQKIRKQYIENLFRQRRQQLFEQQKQQRIKKQKQSCYNNYNGQKHQHIQQIQQFTIQNSNRQDNQNSNHSNINAQSSIGSKIGHELAKQDQDFKKVTSFSCYRQFQEYLNKIITTLPESVNLLVNLFNNNPQLISEFTKYLFTTVQIGTPPKKLFSHDNSSIYENGHKKIKNIHIFIQKFIQCSVVAFLNYIHILQHILIHLQQSSQQRLQLITLTSQRIIQHTFSLLQTNKFIRFDILKGYFDYLVTLGDDIRILSHMEIMMMSDNIREIFTKYYSEDEQYKDYDLYDSVILVSNNIISLGKHCVVNPNNKMKQLDDQYKIQQLKQLFIIQLLKFPKTVQNMIVLAMSPNNHNQLQHILRFLTNLTYVINQPEKMIRFVNPLSIMIISVLGSYKIYERFFIINVLLLRLINNIVVNDENSGQVLWNALVISKAIENYGYWLLEGQFPQEKIEFTKTSEPQSQVLTQFLSTITTYIIMLNNSSNQQQKKVQNIKMAQYNYIQNLSSLIYKKHIHIILLQSLTKSSVCHSDQQIISKCLQSLLILSNYESNTHNHLSQHNPIVNRKLVQYKQLFQNILENVENNNIHAFCQQLLHIVEREEQKIVQEQRQTLQQNKNQEMYEEFMKDYRLQKDNRGSQ